MRLTSWVLVQELNLAVELELVVELGPSIAFWVLEREWDFVVELELALDAKNEAMLGWISGGDGWVVGLARVK